ncbi:MAG: HAMP domain-containing protein, partial [Gammaproteobacteria bacterium]|nr:HAMP domain-containing protein [Gammaproteobacteria bacterium]
MNRSFFGYNLLAFISLVFISVMLTVLLSVLATRQQAIAVAKNQLLSTHELTLEFLADKSVASITAPQTQEIIDRVHTITGVDIAISSESQPVNISTRVETAASVPSLALSVPVTFNNDAQFVLDYSIPGEVALQGYREFALKISVVAILIMAIATAVASIVLGIVNTRLVRRPLRQIRDAVTRVQQGDYSEQLPAHSDDVIGRLARAFNYMQ